LAGENDLAKRLKNFKKVCALTPKIDRFSKKKPQPNSMVFFQEKVGKS
jgi:hypothetical protein